MRRAVLLLIFIVLFPGCTTTIHMLKAEQPSTLMVKPESALLVIIRDTSYGSPYVFLNYLDGKFIGETMGNTYFVTDVPQGEHYVVSSTENFGVACFDFQPGRRYYLRQGVIFGIGRARTSGFYPLTAKEAREAMGRCTYLELDKRKAFPDMAPELYQQAIQDYQTGVKETPEAYKNLSEYRGELLK